jgi:CO/xanthine dehydrogenase FAD-binding subunit
MDSLTYHAPADAGAAAALLVGTDGARPLSGGTDLIVQMGSGRTRPGAIVDIKKVPGTIGVRRTATGFAIGAATPCTALKADGALAAAWPGVVEAANLIGSVQVRNRASMGGNLCNASPAADSVPALVAASARCLVVGPDGEREVAVEDIPAGPGRTTLAPGEFVLEFRLPDRPVGGGDAYLRLTPRTEMDIAIAGAGVSLVLDDTGVCTAARIALGAVAPTVILVPDAAAALVGTRLEPAALDAMAAAVSAACRPIDDKRGSASYRTAMAALLARRAIAIAAERAGRDA